MFCLRLLYIFCVCSPLLYYFPLILCIYCIRLRILLYFFFFFSSRRRHTRCLSDWSSDVCSSDLKPGSRWAIGTETHLVNRLCRAAAERGVHARILSDCQCLCTTMYRIDQPHLSSEERRVGKECRARW